MPITLTDGGLETVLTFDEGFDLPCFAAFPLLDDDRGRSALRDYFTPFLDDAQRRGLPFVLDTPTWRANPDWGAEVGYDLEQLERINRVAVAFARELADGRDDVIVNGAIGPRRDGYVAGEQMSVEEATAYHAWQVGVFAAAGADRVTAMTLTYATEAIGVAQAARAAGIPVVIGFTVETDGRLPDGTSLTAAIEQVDQATAATPVSYLINCAHPVHIAHVADGSDALQRIGALRVNGSRMSHAELDEAEELHAEAPADLANELVALRTLLPNVTTVGGCCGTNHSHVAAIADAWT